MISIIIPIFNEKTILPELLNHLAKVSNNKNCEIILVDGGSTDGSLDILRNSAYTWIGSPKGRAQQMNQGARLAKGSVLVFLHADTLLPQNALQLIEDAYNSTSAHTSTDKFWGRFDIHIADSFFDSSLATILLLPIVSFFMNWRSRLTAIATGDQAIFVSQHLFESVGGFPVQPLMEDIEISKRLRNLSPPICLKEKVKTSGRRWHKYGVFRTIFLMWRLRWEYWRGQPIEKIAAKYD